MDHGRHEKRTESILWNPREEETMSNRILERKSAALMGAENFQNVVRSCQLHTLDFKNGM